MVTFPNEWQILEWDEKLQTTNKQTFTLRSADPVMWLLHVVCTIAILRDEIIPIADLPDISYDREELQGQIVLSYFKVSIIVFYFSR